MRLVLTLLIGFFLTAQSAAFADTQSTENVTATLAADVNAIAPGDDFNLVLEMKIRKNWHTYWINPGDAGEPTRIAWDLPQGISVDQMVWPVPHTIALGPLVNYGYKDTATYIIPAHADKALQIGEILPIKADAMWLVCEDICIPEQASFTLTIQTAAQTLVNPKWAGRVNMALNATAKPDPSIRAAVTLANGVLKYSFAGPGLDGAQNPYFFPIDTGAVKHAEPQKISRGTDGFTLWTLPGFRAKDGLTTAHEGILVFEGKADGKTTRRAVALAAQPNLALDGTGADTPPGQEQGKQPRGMGGFLQAIVFAFIGGVILNLMPCVFPVLSMKAMGFVIRAHDEAAQIRRHGLLFLVGVLVSFLALAGVLIALKASGQQIGWGFQLQYPPFVAVLALLFFILGLVLLGFLHFGGGFMGLGDKLTRSGGNSGAFFTGVLAVVVASPCTAPAMGWALGFTLTQGPLVTLMVFGALGLGFAAPFTALSFFPALLRLLPKPGDWMVRFGQLMAFPMFAAAVWLVWVLDGQAGAIGVAAVLAAMVLLTFIIWAAKGQRAGKISAAIAFIAMLFILWSGLNGKDASALEPQIWSPGKVVELQAQGHVVFVDFTADWCVTCQVNERVALSSKKVREAFHQADTVYLVADWTNRNDDIARTLAEHDRAGVPLYLVYGPKNAKPVVLPQILTPSIVINAVRGAGE